MRRRRRQALLAEPPEPIFGSAASAGDDRLTLALAWVKRGLPAPTDNELGARRLLRGQPHSAEAFHSEQHWEGIHVQNRGFGTVGFVSLCASFNCVTCLEDDCRLCSRR